MDAEDRTDIPATPDQPAAEAAPGVPDQDVPASKEQGPEAPVMAGTPLAPPQAPAAERGPADRSHVRERLVRRFETWLDEVLDEERPIEGIAAEILEQLDRDPTACEPRGAAGDCDLYSLWSALTAMAEETRLQGRAFKQLHEGLAPIQGMVESVGSVLQRYMTSLEQQDQRLSESTRQAVLKEVLGTLIDVRDRLIRGADSASTWLEQAQAPPKLGLAARVWQKVAPPPPGETPQLEAVRSLFKGYSLGQEVLDEALARFGVRPIDGVGKPFDPGTMKAVDIDLRSDAAEGTVLEVYRQGYWWHEAVYRPAEVKVARRKAVE